MENTKNPVPEMIREYQIGNTCYVVKSVSSFKRGTLILFFMLAYSKPECRAASDTNTGICRDNRELCIRDRLGAALFAYEKCRAA